jgi:hypothetical protein
MTSDFTVQCREQTMNKKVQARREMIQFLTPDCYGEEVDFEAED